jgi:hypothetical protein
MPTVSTALFAKEETMLEEKLGEFHGKVTGQRVLPSEQGPKVETSFETQGTLCGVEATLMGTYWSMVRPDGTLYGACPMQGLLMTGDGSVGTWTGAGVGRFTAKGAAVSFRGAVYFQTVPQQLARLTQVAVLYEWEIDEQGNASTPF